MSSERVRVQCYGLAAHNPLRISLQRDSSQPRQPYRLITGVALDDGVGQLLLGLRRLHLHQLLRLRQQIPTGTQLPIAPIAALRTERTGQVSTLLCAAEVAPCK